MSQLTLETNPARSDFATKMLNISATFWLGVTLIGQLAFLVFITGFYVLTSLQGNFQAWSKKSLITGYVAGDTIGNLAFAIHVVIAAVVVLSGLLQLIPHIRQRAPQFHRWNGRLFMVALLAASVGGLYLTWVRGSYLNTLSAVTISINAALIFTFSALAWLAIRRRDIASHRRWALRTFMVASGVWFMRVGYFGWILIMQGPVGIGGKMDGPFDVVIGFGSYLLPLAVLEFYLRAKEDPRPQVRLFVAATLAILTCVMLIGAAGVTLLLWRPALLK